MEKPNKLCPRLIDYLVVVGRRNPGRVSRAPSQSSAADAQSASNNNASSTVNNPELVRRYPVNDHKDFYLPTDVTVFCQPEGCITIAGPKRMSSFRETTSFVFTLTEKDSAKIRYGICLNFYRCFERKNAELSGATAPIQRKHKRRHKHMNHTLTSLCLISHHPFFTTFRETLTLLRKLIDSSNQRVCGAKKSPGGKLSRDAVWSVLTGQWVENIPATVMHEIREIETWILTLLSAPVPVPGKTRVELEMVPKELGDVLCFALPDHTRFSLVDFPLHLPLELLGVDSVVKVLTCVMLEYKVVLQSRNYNAVSMCVLALVALMYPLEYMFPVIPLLPAYMAGAEQLLLAPTPYIIGVPAAFFQFKRLTRLPSDVVLVDLDSNRVLIPEGIRYPGLPEPDTTNLKNHFRQALANMSYQPQPIRNLNDLSETDTKRILAQQSDPGAASQTLLYGNDTDAVDVATRVAMIRFLNSTNILSNFTEHTRTLRLYPRPVVALQVESFLRSRPQSSEFVSQLCRTQAVEYFAECSLCPKNEAYLRVQTGIDDPVQVGDKPKWYAQNFQTVEFKVYPANSTLAAALQSASNGRQETDMTDESGGSGASDGEGSSAGGSMSSIDDLVFEPDNDFDPLADFGASKPLSEVNDVYHEPLAFELPESESAQSIGSSASSGRSSPASSLSTSAMDSEADFARLADNLALKSDGKGDFSFDRSAEYDSKSETPVQSRRPLPSPLQKVALAQSQSGSSSSTPTNKTPPIKTGIKAFSNLSDSGEKVEKVLGPASTQLMSALNGYAEKSQDMLGQVLRRPFPLTGKSSLIKHSQAGAGAQTMPRMSSANQRKAMDRQQGKENAEKASQQNKNQQVVREICDQVLQGQGVGVFTYPKLKRLMEDESLRELACSKLNLGIDHKHSSEDEDIEDVQITRAQYKGILKVLQACVAGIETSYGTPGSNGLASTLHVLEIAHTHFWAKEVELPTPGSGLSSLLGTPSESMHDLRHQQQHTQQRNSIDPGAPGHLQRNSDARASIEHVVAGVVFVHFILLLPKSRSHCIGFFLFTSPKICSADQICYAVLCVFSYVAAAAQQKNQQNAKSSGAAADVSQSVGSTVAGER
uniref:MAP kinase-activating death domain protein n=1 Tax=Plectus sambesii TaxID=2011161 RepID=A0A914WGL6_9BILA